MIANDRSKISYLFLTGLAGLCLGVCQSNAATFSHSTTAPDVNGTDIAQFSGSPGSTFDVGKWFPGTSHPGQTFTPATDVLFKAISLRTGTGSGNPGFTFRIRVREISGGNPPSDPPLNYSETATWTSGASSNNSYLTFTLDTPQALKGGTAYAVDVEFVSTTQSHDGNLMYLYWQGSNAYAGGSAYIFSAGSTAISLNSGRDYTFHLDMEHPQAPSPDIGATVPAGNVNLGWTNLPPTTGTDVWVDVWFGTNPNMMTKIVDKGLNTTSHTVSAPTAATYYWRVDTYRSGPPTGSPTTGQVFNFIVTDSDNDGLPDAYELLHTTPASNTALNTGDDLDTDGLTNLQEFQRGTLPLDSDTDNDTLLDGPELTGVDLRAATNPLVADTDNDGFNDGAESNTGTWVSLSNTGTNPIIADTDSDGLKDGSENNSGTYVSRNNAGSNPLDPDSDDDGAGDWYEAAASFTNPSNNTAKPNVPYPLSDPDNSTGTTTSPVKVYILSGQSNMVGFGQIGGSGPGTLQTITAAENKFPNLVASGGGWTTRRDVKYHGVITDIAQGDLKADVAGDKFGPELGFGYVMGYHHGEPVLIIKASQGNRGLFWDLLPPGSPRVINGTTIFAGYGESPANWQVGGGPSAGNWWAGKQYDDFFKAEADMGYSTLWESGKNYDQNFFVKHNGSIFISKAAHTSVAGSPPGVGTDWNYYGVDNVTDILDNFATRYPSWAAQGFEIAGYVWFQGNHDLQSGGLATSRYEINLVQLIKQLRSYYANRYIGKCSTNTPFVVATGCGDPGTSGNGLAVANAQLAINDTMKYPEFTGNVKTMDTRDYWRDSSVSPSGQGYHYNWNAETYMLTGDALARGMIDLLSTPQPPDTSNPTLLTLAPTNLSSGIPGSNNLAVTFDESITRGTGFITLKNLTDFTQSQINVTDGAQVSILGSIFTINPTADLIEGKNYAIQIDPTAIDDLAGNSFDGITNDTTWSFATVAPAPPIIVSLSPADDSSNAFAAGNLIVTFNENVIIGTGNITIMNLSDASQSTIAITDATKVSVAGAVLTINPSADLLVGKNYAIQIAGSAITDFASYPFAGIAADTTWNFTTAILPPNTAIWLGIFGNWSAADIWQSGVIGTGIDFNVNFTGVDITANQTITLDTARTIGNITFDDSTTSSNNLTISGANILTLDRTSGMPIIDIPQADRTLTISSIIAGNDGLQKTGPGTLILTGNNTYTGTTTISAGELRLSGGAYTTTARTYQIDSGAVLSFSGSNQNPNATTTTIQGTGTLRVLNGASVFAGAGGRKLNMNLGAGSVIDIEAGGTLGIGYQPIVWTNNLATLNMDGTHDFWDDNPVAAAALTGSGTIASTHGSGLFNFTLGVNNGSGTFSGNITAAGNRVVSLVKNGTGSQTFSGSSIFRGATTVNAGTLAITGSLSTSGVTVNNTATLGGNGNITGNVNIASGGRHSLAVASTPGAQVTRAITGSLALTGGNILDLAAAAPPAAGVYVLATATTAITGAPTTINYNGIDGTVSVDTASSPKRLLLTVTSSGNTYANWIANYPGAASMPGFTQDADGDGIKNGVENFFGTDPSVFTAGLTSGTRDSNSFTFTHPQNASPAGNISATYRWSKDLVTLNTSGATDGAGTTVTFTTQLNTPNAGITTVTATVTGTTTTKLFVDVEVIQN